MTNLTFGDLARKINSEADAYSYLETLRWTGKPVCPHCGVEGDHYYLKPVNGVSRQTRTGAVSQRRVWKCRECRKQFSVLTGTIMHGTKAQVRIWVLVIFELCLSKNGVSAAEISRKYGVCQMREKDGARKLCVISSTFIIDSDGVVRHALYDINPRGHVSEVLQLVKQLEKPCKLRKIPS